MKFTSFCSLCPALNQLVHMGECLNVSITFFLVFHVVGSPHHKISFYTTPSPNRTRFS